MIPDLTMQWWMPATMMLLTFLPVLMLIALIQVWMVKRSRATAVACLEQTEKFFPKKYSVFCVVVLLIPLPSAVTGGIRFDNGIQINWFIWTIFSVGLVFIGMLLVVGWHAIKFRIRWLKELIARFDAQGTS